MKNAQRLTGRIVALNYQHNSQELKQVTLDTFSNNRITLTSGDILNPELSQSETSNPELLKPEFIEIENLNNFRERFQEAANFGHGLALILDRQVKKIINLIILPQQDLSVQLQGPTGNPGCVPGVNC